MTKNTENAILYLRNLGRPFTEEDIHDAHTTWQTLRKYTNLRWYHEKRRVEYKTAKELFWALNGTSEDPDDPGYYDVTADLEDLHYDPERDVVYQQWTVDLYRFED